VSNVPNEPQITAIVRSNGTGEVAVDGERFEMQTVDVASARAAVIARVAEEAGSRGRPVRVATTDLDGVYALIVHPNGDVESEGPIRADEAVIAQPESALAPPPPFGLGDLIGFTELGPDPTPGSGKHFEPARTRRSTFRAHGDDAGRTDATDDSVMGEPEVLPANGAATALVPDLVVSDPPLMPETGPASSAVGSARPAAADLPTHVAEPALAPSRAGIHSLSAEGASEAVPTLDDFLQSRPSAPEGPAKQGWQGFVRRMTGGVLSPRPGKAEQSHRDAIHRVQRGLKGPRTIVVLNPKGGAHKTTATLLLAATFGIHRGGSTLAWDNNETRGTLGWRAQPSRHSNTAVDLLRDVHLFADVRSARVGHLDNYVRGQGDAQFDVLASDEDAAASSTIDAKAFDSLHSTLSRFYRLLVIDTGNNMRASNWEAAVEAADQLVVVTTVNEETAASAAWLLDGLRQKGHQDKVSQAVTILSAPGDAVQPELTQRLHTHFSALTRVVLEVPYDQGFQSGGPLNVEVLAPQTREAWLRVTAAVADGL
jgi:MinD-like ATPase involved in chromosome partitioning or flagellar assembly